MIIIYSAPAKEDLKLIYEYIAYSLQSPSSAKSTVQKIINSINALTLFPEKHQIYNGIKLNENDIRYITVNNYMVFYSIDNSNSHILIIRIIYGRRDIPAQLEDK